jgi:hypothetical protein
VNGDGNGNQSLFWLMHPANAKIAATMPVLFPNMTPSGGEMFGVTALVSNAVDNDSIVLLDADGIGADAGPITLRSSDQTDIEMAETPGSDASTGVDATLTSMFQTNGVALMAVCNFAVEKLRSDAVAVLQGVSWGAEIST